MKIRLPVGVLVNFPLQRAGHELPADPTLTFRRDKSQGILIFLTGLFRATTKYFRIGQHLERTISQIRWAMLYGNSAQEDFVHRKRPGARGADC
jgi:hypothetical protein